MKKTITILIVVLMCWFVYACSDNSVSPARPKINSVSSDNLVVGDTMSLSGKNFTYNYSAAKLIFSSGQTLQPSDCIKWNNNFIKLIIPTGASTGFISVVTGKDTSNKIEISIVTIPSIEMVIIQPDSFQMGNVNGFKSEMPLHKITISKSFYIGKYEITQRCWEAVIGSNPSIFRGPHLPVHNISWSEAVKFCNKLSGASGFKPYYMLNNDTVSIDTTSYGYRLPTEAEWEYCCKAKVQGDYSGTGILDDMGWYSFNSAYYPHDVGNKKPNYFGLYDMHGNVWEWCWDYLDENYYNTSPKINPNGPKTGKIHVLRGGSYIDGAAFCRSSNRNYPYSTFENCGLRVTRTKESN